MTATRQLLPIVLIVEDNADLQMLYKLELTGHFVTLQAVNTKEADFLYEKLKEYLFAVVLDGNLGLETSLELAKKIVADRFCGAEQAYLGELIANSDHRGLQDELVEAGCRRNKCKADLAQMLISMVQTASASTAAPAATRP